MDANGMTLKDFEELNMAVSTYRRSLHEVEWIKKHSYAVFEYEGPVSQNPFSVSRISMRSLEKEKEISETISKILLHQAESGRDSALGILKKYNFNLSDLEERE